MGEVLMIEAPAENPDALVLCVVCASPTETVRDLPATDIRLSLSRLYERPLSGIPMVAHYKMQRCPACSLEFANPMLPGDDIFYGWVVKQAGYYPGERWGWSNIRRAMVGRAAASSEGALVVMDVGCGAGAFLKYMTGVPNIRVVGVDTTESSVVACTQAGLEAHVSDIRDARKILPEGVDLVTMFHCLEHVSDPVEFLRAARSVLSPNGSIVVTTPYSPMSFEARWYDPLNHPPHHLTRWNEAAYHALGKNVGMSVEVILGPTSGTLRRSARALALRAGQTLRQVGKWRKILSLLSYIAGHPLDAIEEIRAQAMRQRVRGMTAPDEVMVVFRISAASSFSVSG